MFHVGLNSSGDLQNGEPLFTLFECEAKVEKLLQSACKTEKTVWHWAAGNLTIFQIIFDGLEKWKAGFIN